MGVADFLAYHRALRRLAEELQLTDVIAFADVADMLATVEGILLPKPSDAQTEEEMTRRLTIERQHLLRHQSSPINHNGEGKAGMDANQVRVYQGFIKFLETDLAEQESMRGLSRAARKKRLAAVAREMMHRGEVSLYPYR